MLARTRPPIHSTRALSRLSVRDFFKVGGSRHQTAQEPAGQGRGHGPLVTYKLLYAPWAEVMLLFLLSGYDCLLLPSITMQDPSALAPPVLPFGDFRAETDPDAVASVLHHHDRLHSGSLATSELPDVMAKLGASWSDLELKEIRQVSSSRHVCRPSVARKPCCM